MKILSLLNPLEVNKVAISPSLLCYDFLIIVVKIVLHDLYLICILKVKFTTEATFMMHITEYKLNMNCLLLVPSK